MRTAISIITATMASVTIVGIGGGNVWAAEQRFGAVAVYAAPPEAGAPTGQAFAAPTQAQVIEIAVQSCKANTVKGQWANCAIGRWIGTGNDLLVASVCTIVDDEGDRHETLFFLKDGVTATDEQIRAQAELRVSDGTIPDGGCRKVAVYDRDKPARTEVEESLVARSVGKDIPH